MEPLGYTNKRFQNKLIPKEHAVGRPGVHMSRNLPERLVPDQQMLFSCCMRRVRRSAVARETPSVRARY